MKNYCAVDSKGVIVSTFRLMDDAEAEMNCPQGCIMIGGEADRLAQYYDESASAFKEYPPKPGPWAQFDYLNKTWFDPRTEEDLVREVAEAKDNAVVTINKAIGEIRSRFVTVIPAQDMLYQAKEAEAKAYLTDPAPIASEYPFIHAEIGITGQDAWQVAQVYVNQALILRHTAAQLETVRLGHIAMVEAATEVGAVEAALSSFNQVVEAL